ncbi:hypothetical protein AgCh_031484 [Apium graveolens]
MADNNNHHHHKLQSQEQDDEENDTEQSILIRSSNSSPSHRRSAFHINNPSFNAARRCVNKRYLFAILLPFFFLIVYFTTDLKSIFFRSSLSDSNFDNISRMRESELRAISLLQNQQLRLINLLNHTSFVNNSAYLNSALLTQISINKQIQHALLFSHQLGNMFNDDNSSNDTDRTYFGACPKLDVRFAERRSIEWKPRENKYLFAICVSGQMSNHLICLEKHMFFAAVLNRVLVIPSPKVDYEFSHVLDVEHINKCLGRKVVVTFDEFAETKKNHLHIDRFVCYVSLPTACFVDEDHLKKLKPLGVSYNKLETAWVEDVKKPTVRTIHDVAAKFSSDDDVIAIGDVFFADVEREWVMQPGGPIAHKCKTLIEPSRLIMLTAQRFIQTFLGEGFTALHFRRHGFLKFCNAKKPSCFFPVPQAADCITRVVERANTPVIYLSTDAAESETSLLQSLVILNGKTVPLIKRPARNSAEKWDALLYRHGLQEDSQVDAMLDKTICALSSVFIGSSGSTFTEDILRLRKDWGSASQCDEYLCESEQPSFIAEDE